MRHLLAFVVPAALFALAAVACSGGKATTSPGMETPFPTAPAASPSAATNVLAAQPATPPAPPTGAAVSSAPASATGSALPIGGPGDGSATILVSPATPATPVAPTPAPAAANPDGSSAQVVTPADNGRTLTMSVGETFLLKLGDGSWSPEVDNQAVVSRVPNVMVIRGAQGIYRAHAAGTAHLQAQDGSTTFSLTIVVQ